MEKRVIARSDMRGEKLFEYVRMMAADYEKQDMNASVILYSLWVDLTRHLSRAHGWTPDELAKEVRRHNS